MKELFREQDITRVSYYKAVLEGNGIPTIIRNEYLTGAGFTEIPIPEFFPALCVLNDGDYVQAVTIIREHLTANQKNSDVEITCISCGETNPGNFDVCWSCGNSVSATQNAEQNCRQRMKPITNATQDGPSPVREGLFGLVVSGISAAISITAIMTWIYMDGSTATIDSGGPAFAANIGPMLNSLLGIASGGIGLLVTACSVWFSEKRFPKSFTFYHFCSLIFLIPSAILLVTMLTR